MKTIFKLLGSGGGFDTQATQPGAVEYSPIPL